MRIVIRLLLVVLILISAAAAAVYRLSERRLTRHYEVSVETIAIPTDAASIERGGHIAKIRGCRECHGDDLGGATVVEDPKAGMIYGVNLTRGRGGLADNYSDADFLRAIRHGVGRDGHPLLLMPSAEFHALTDEDVGAVIAYVKNVPPVDRQVPPSHFGPIMRTVLVLDKDAQLLSAEHIDHAARQSAAAPTSELDRGRYLAVSCTFCHGDGFSGGVIPGVPPDFPPAKNLTTGGEMKDWSEEQFAKVLRTGLRPDGRKLDSKYMPWTAFKAMSDAEIRALWDYLRSVPPKADGNR